MHFQYVPFEVLLLCPVWSFSSSFIYLSLMQLSSKHLLCAVGFVEIKLSVDETSINIQSFAWNFQKFMNRRKCGSDLRWGRLRRGWWTVGICLVKCWSAIAFYLSLLFLCFPPQCAHNLSSKLRFNILNLCSESQFHSSHIRSFVFISFR